MAAGLNIAALAQRTGVAPDTLRKWEQRYRILRPSRTPGGQRRYSERDVARVEWLLLRLGEGYRIGEAATLLGDVDVAPTRTPEGHLATIVAALDDATTVGILVDQAFALHGVDVTLDRILRPLLHDLGERWARGVLTAGEEHLVTEAVRSRLAHLLADAGGGVRGVAVLACAPGEQHDLGLMMVAIALRRDGWKIVYLGANTPLDDAVALAKKHDARVLAISSTVAPAPDLSELDGIAVIVGGPGSKSHSGGLEAAVSAVRRFAA
jgi:DNA-binding transcriptional MerR regulator